MKNPNRKRNEFEAPAELDVNLVGMRAVTEREGQREHMPPLCGVCLSPSACMEVSESREVKLHCHCLTYCKIK
jgi:hypothetical protein